MASDGSIIIDTGIDTGGFEADHKQIQSGLRRLKDSLSRAGKDAQNSFGLGGQAADKMALKVDKANEAVQRHQNTLTDLQSKFDAIKSGDVVPPSIKKLENELNQAEKEWAKLAAQAENAHLKVEQLDFGIETDALTTAKAEMENLALKTDEAFGKLQEAERSLNSLKMDPATSAEAQKLAREIDLGNQKLKRLQTEAQMAEQALQQAGQTGGEAVRHVAKETKNTNKGLEGMSKGLTNMVKKVKSLVMAAFVFNLIRKALRNLVTSLGNALKSNENFTRSVAQIKGNLATAFAPIYQAALPAINALMSALSKATAVLAQFMSALFGKTVKQSAAAAKGLFSTAKGIGATGKAAKKAAGSLAAFDEIQTLAANNDGGGGGGSGGADMPIFDVGEDIEIKWLDDLKAKIKPIVELFKKIDLSPLITSLGGLWESIKPLFDFGLDGLLWFLEHVIYPLSKVAIEETLPAYFDALAKALDFVRSVLEPLRPVWEWVWENLLLPIAKWSGGVTREALEEIGKAFERLTKVFKEKGDKITDTLITIGGWIKWLWDKIVKPVFDVIWKHIKNIFDKASKFLASTVEYIIDVFAGWVSFIDNVFKGNWKEAWEDIKGIFTAWWKWIKETVGIIKDALIEYFEIAWEGIKKVWEPVIRWFGGIWTGIKEKFANTHTWFKEKFSTAWTKIKESWAKVKEWFGGIWTGIKEKFANTHTWFKEKFDNAWKKIKEVFSTQKAKEYFSGVWTGIKNSFGNIPNWFKEKFSEAWQKVKDVFSKGGKIFDGIKDGILNGLKAVINALIDGINKVVSVPFNGINTALKRIKSVSIAGLKPFNFVSTISVPKIPRLATGAVIPPNREFLAILGDQKSGTNIETPAETMLQMFRQALAEMGGVGGQSTVILEVDGREFGRAVVDTGKQENRRRGVRLVKT